MSQLWRIFLFIILVQPILPRCEEGLLHECGVAFVRLRKPIAYYKEKYQDPAWGTKKLLSLMEKQRNRGQDGAGIAVVKLNTENSIHCSRNAEDHALDKLVSNVLSDISETKEHSFFIGESLLGHLRYATYAGNNLQCCQPFLRSHDIPSHEFALCGNFNMTNTFELNEIVKSLGFFQKTESDTETILNLIAHHIDQAYACLESSSPIELANVLYQAAEKWDGGYVFCGILGTGEAFICRDPAGIRPAYYFMNEEVLAVASEKAALMDTFPIEKEEIKPIKPGHLLSIKTDGEIRETAFTTLLPEKPCSFERIYFSKAGDSEIHQERKALGRALASKVYAALDGNFEHTIFTYVPNSSLLAFQGLIEEIANIKRLNLLNKIIDAAENSALAYEEIEKFANSTVQVEYLIAKNQKMRTFISPDQKRQNLVSQLYEITKGIVTPEDTLVVVDDSIVRGTTLKESLIRELIQLNPKKILIVSSAPPVLYPDCYGIDMSQIGRFIAFQAMVSLLKENNQENLLEEVNTSCLNQLQNSHEPFNEIKRLYERFSLDTISQKIAELLTPSNIEWKGSIQVIYQTIEGLHQALPYYGDWYFTGNYPTSGGFRVLNNSYLQWFKGNDSRCY